MLCNFEDNRFSKILKLTVFWLSLIAMITLFIVIFSHEIRPQQKMTALEIDIENKVNICLPEENDELF